MENIKAIKKELKNCPFCNGNAMLVECSETADGVGELLPYVSCECGAIMTLSYEELYELKKSHNYKGGYLSSYKTLWNDMHAKVVEKWNKRQ